MRNKNILSKLSVTALICCICFGFTINAKCEQPSANYFAMAQALEKTCPIKQGQDKKQCLEKMIEYCTTALELNDEWIIKHRSWVYGERAAVHGQLGNLDEQIKDFNSALASDDNSLNEGRSVLYFSLGSAYGARGNANIYTDINKAIEDTNKSIEYYTIALDFNDNIGGHRSMAYFGRGSSYLFLEEFDKTINDVSAALEFNDDIEGNLFLAYFIRGRAYRHIKKLDEAINDFESALKLDDLWSNNKLYRELVSTNLQELMTQGENQTHQDL